jgi:hypothetical protein
LVVFGFEGERRTEIERAICLEWHEEQRRFKTAAQKERVNMRTGSARLNRDTEQQESSAFFLGRQSVVYAAY